MSEHPAELNRRGCISPEVALARLILSGCSPEQAATELTAAGYHALARIALERREALARLSRLVEQSGVDHAATALDGIRAMFDRAVALSPEASVAAYSLGDAGVLDRATAELLAWLNEERLLGLEKDVLDLGCGIGRVALAIAPRARSVLGLDVSPGMIDEAQRRNARENLRFAVTSGLDLARLRDRSFDLVLAVDSFPYLVQAGVAERHAAEAARVLRPGGALAILNLSYRSLDEDRAAASRWAEDYGFDLVRDGTAPFTLWDGVAFLLQRTHGA
jgi:SAM-dependent methyltransferase